MKRATKQLDKIRKRARRAARAGKPKQQISEGCRATIDAFVAEQNQWIDGCLP
jgi:hypothetical protein